MATDIYTVQKVKDGSPNMRLSVNGGTLGHIIYKMDNGGIGWVWMPNYQAKSSRRYWDTPLLAIRHRVSRSAFDAVAAYVSSNKGASQ